MQPSMDGMPFKVEIKCKQGLKANLSYTKHIKSNYETIKSNYKNKC